ncbi:MAG: exodeoxyribonuclease VII small subunit [Nostocaceae cyanobacterium]|nr:exodeoxyribonuclease VII small subunit [Nostocaceae cyanobacterium]
MVKGNKGQDREHRDWSYEDRVAQVEGIIARLEAGELGLEEVFAEFAAAVESLRECEGFLHSRRRQVDLLIETLQDETEG